MPNNIALYDAAIAGASGACFNERYITSDVSADYNDVTAAVTALATAIDNQIPPIVLGVTTEQASVLQSIVQGVISSRLLTSANPNDYTVIADAIASAWISADVHVIPIPEPPTLLAPLNYVGVAGDMSTIDVGPLVIGEIILDPSTFLQDDITCTIIFQTMLLTQAIESTAQVDLYNLDDSEYITDSTLSSNSLTPQRRSTGALTIGTAVGNIKPTLKTYEVQLSKVGGLPATLVTCRLAGLYVTFSD